MKNLKLTIDLLPKGAWNNDFSKTLSKKDWDTLRYHCYQKANHKCQICGYQTDELDAHEVWEFDIKHKTQTLKDIMAICSKCHGVKHFKNSIRLGYGDQAKEHFIKTNKCSEIDFVNHLLEAKINYDERNKIYRWKIIANLEQFGGKDIEIKERNIPIIENPYENIDLNKASYSEMKKLFTMSLGKDNYIRPPRLISIDVNNYQGIITVTSLFANKIEWFLDGNKIKTKYNIIDKLKSQLSVKEFVGNNLYFKLTNNNGELTSRIFVLKEFNQ